MLQRCDEVGQLCKRIIVSKLELIRHFVSDDDDDDDQASIADQKIFWVHFRP